MKQKFHKKFKKKKQQFLRGPLWTSFTIKMNKQKREITFRKAIKIEFICEMNVQYTNF